MRSCYNVHMSISVMAPGAVGLYFLARLVVAGGSASSRVGTWFDSSILNDDRVVKYRHVVRIAHQRTCIVSSLSVMHASRAEHFPTEIHLSLRSAHAEHARQGHITQLIGISDSNSKTACAVAIGGRIA